MWTMGGLAVLVAGGLVALLVVMGSSGGSPPPKPDAAALTAYTTALRPPTSEGGRIVQQEMKPSLSEFGSGTVDGPTFAARARGWQLALARVRDDIDKIAVPPSIPSAGPLFHDAMTAYVHAAQLFEQAGTAPADRRQSAVDAAIAAARAADQAFDRAAVVVQRALRAAGLPPDSALPNPSPSASPG